MKKEPLSAVVFFKSTPTFYWKEKTGIKPNTIRKLDDDDVRFLSLRHGCNRVRIINRETGESFERKVTDYSEWNGFAVISWKNEAQE